MFRVALRRLAALPLVLLALVTLTFFLSQVIPADPVVLLVGYDAPKETLDRARRELGLDRPLTEQYVIYLWRLSRGDLGTSIVHRSLVATDIRRYFPATFEMILFALGLAVTGGVLLGLYAAIHRGRSGDLLARLLGVTGASVPVFWLALLFQIAFFRYAHWLPAEGRLPVSVDPPRMITGLYVLDSLLTGNWTTLRLSAIHLILPSVTLAANSFGLFLRMTRATALWVLGEDYVRTAWSKGLRLRQVMFRHVLQNTAIPLLTEVGLQFGRLLSASFLVEIIFSWPGISSYAVRSTTAVDVPAIMGVVLLYASLYVIVNFLVDMAYVLADPRMAYQ